MDLLPRHDDQILPLLPPFTPPPPLRPVTILLSMKSTSARANGSDNPSFAAEK